jgi:hypothetical protein
MPKRLNAELTGWADAARHLATEQMSTRGETFENSLGSANPHATQSASNFPMGWSLLLTTATKLATMALL